MDPNYTSSEDHLHHLSKLSAIFLLEIKEQHKLTQVAIQAIVGGITNLTQVNVTMDTCIYIPIQLPLLSQLYMTSLHTRVKEKLLLAGVEQQHIDEVNKLFGHNSPYCNPFQEVSTPHHQLAFLRKNFRFTVSSSISKILLKNITLLHRSHSVSHWKSTGLGKDRDHIESLF